MEFGEGKTSKPATILSKTELSKAYLPISDFGETKDCTKMQMMLTNDMINVTNEGKGQLEKTFFLPKDWKGKCIYLRFEQVGCITKVQINKKSIGKHYGGYTTWDMDITEFVKTGEDNELSITLEEDRTHLNPYEIMGIHGGISLISLPENHIKSIIVTTDVYMNSSEKSIETKADINIQIQGTKLSDLASATHKTACGCRIFDKHNKVIAEMIEKVDNDKITINSTLSNPHLWSADEPNLYRAQIDWYDHGTCIETVMQSFGIRKVEVKDRELCVNEEVVKLKGVCIKEPHGIGSFEKLSKDLVRLKNANVNYLRIMYYPATKGLLSLCDELGFYVQEQASVHCVDQINTAMASTQNAPEYACCYQDQFMELMHRDINHPSIIIWSLGSESTFGTNMKSMYNYCREHDTSRLLNFSYPMSIPEEEIKPDLWSVYHPDVRLDFDGHFDQFIIFHTPGSDNEIGYQVGFAPDEKMPVIFDAYARIPADCRDERKRDPAIHEFWGESIIRFQDKINKTKGCVGGSIESLYDEIFDSEEDQLHAIMYERETGILTPEGYEKPEFFHMSKAFDDDVVRALSEEAQVIVKDTVKPDIADPVKPEIKEPDCLRITKSGNDYMITDGEFTYTFANENDYLLKAERKGELIIEKGPVLITTGLTLEAWKDAGIKVSQAGGNVYVQITGFYGKVVKVLFMIEIKPEGRLHTEYEILELNQPMPHRVKIHVGVTPGGVDEFGIAYQMPGTFDEVCWDRKTRYSDYKKDHIGRPVGSAKKMKQSNTFAGALIEPVLYGTYDVDWKGSNDFRALRADCRTYSLCSGTTSVTARASESVPVEGQEKYFSARANAVLPEKFLIDDRDERINYHGTWYEMDDACGNYKGTETLSKEQGAYADLCFSGTGICLYGPSDMIYGKSRIYLDGQLMAEGIDQYPSRAETLGMSRGYEKRYKTLLYAVDDLKNGKHTIKVEVMGEKQDKAQECYVSIDEFAVLDSNKASVQMLLLQDFQYNRMVYGNYRKEPILFEKGSKGAFDIKMDERTERGLS